jgi:2-oxoglutarate dehydrogenase E2 component (dihydrolipoamide succinyltransferase)
VVIESDKLSQEIRSPLAGVLVETCATEGQEVAVGADLFKIDPSQQKGAAPAKEAPKAKETPQEAPKEAAKKEVQPEVASKPAEKPAEKPAAPKPAQKPADKPGVQVITQTIGKREEKREKLSKMRKRIAERLKGAQNTYAMLTTFQEVIYT